MRGLLILTLLHAVLTHGQKCGMAMQVQPQDQLSSGSTVALPKEQTDKLLDSIDTPLTVDYIRCDGDNGSCLVRLEVDKAHAQELKAEFDRKKPENIEVTDAFCPDVKSEL